MNSTPAPSRPASATSSNVVRRLSVVPSRAPSAREDLDAEVIEEVVRALCAMNRARTLSLMLDVGALIVERVFHGDLEKLKSRGRKDRSLRKLVAHPKLPFSAATLWRAVAIYELVRRFPGLVDAKSLGVSHLRAVLGLPPAVQERLVRAAELEKWSIERLEQVAAEHRRATRGQGGRPRIPGIIKSAHRIEHILRRCPVLDEMAFMELSVDQRDSIRTTVESLRQWCQVVERSMEADSNVLADELVLAS